MAKEGDINYLRHLRIVDAIREKAKLEPRADYWEGARKGEGEGEGVHDSPFAAIFVSFLFALARESDNKKIKKILEDQGLLEKNGRDYSLLKLFYGFRENASRLEDRLKQKIAERESVWGDGTELTVLEEPILVAGIKRELSPNRITLDPHPWKLYSDLITETGVAGQRRYKSRILSGDVVSVLRDRDAVIKLPQDEMRFEHKMAHKLAISDILESCGYSPPEEKMNKKKKRMK